MPEYRCEYCSSKYDGHEEARSCELSHAPSGDKEGGWLCRLTWDSERKEWIYAVQPVMYWEERSVRASGQDGSVVINTVGGGEFLSASTVRWGAREEADRARRVLEGWLRGFLKGALDSLDAKEET